MLRKRSDKQYFSVFNRLPVTFVEPLAPVPLFVRLTEPLTLSVIVTVTLFSVPRAGLNPAKLMFCVGVKLGLGGRSCPNRSITR